LSSGGRYGKLEETGMQSIPRPEGTGMGSAPRQRGPLEGTVSARSVGSAVGAQRPGAKRHPARRDGQGLRPAAAGSLGGEMSARSVESALGTRTTSGPKATVERPVSVAAWSETATSPAAAGERRTLIRSRYGVATGRSTPSRHGRPCRHYQQSQLPLSRYAPRPAARPQTARRHAWPHVARRASRVGSLRRLRWRTTLPKVGSLRTIGTLSTRSPRN